MKQRSIILIGASKAGKTTISRHLADALNWTPLDLDNLRWGYYAEAGYDAKKAQKIRAEGGLTAIATYWKQFDDHAVNRMLADYPYEHVIAFGAGHSVYDDETQFERVQKALTPFPHVIHLRPSSNHQDSLTILRQRLAKDDPELSEQSVKTIMAFEDYFLRHPSNASLATQTIYNAGKSVEATCQEIIKALDF